MQMSRVSCSGQRGTSGGLVSAIGLMTIRIGVRTECWEGSNAPHLAGEKMW